MTDLIMKNKKKIIGIIIIIAFMVITFHIFMKSEEIAEFPQLLKRLNPVYIYIAIGLMVFYLIINGLIIYIAGKKISTQITFMRSMYLSFVGQYYSLITPFASGGQPAQIYAMKAKYQIPVSVGTTITVKKFLIFQVVVSLYAVAMFITKINFILERYTGILLFIVIGLLVNLFGGALILLLSYNKSVVIKILDILIIIAKKFRLSKYLQRETLLEHIEDYVEKIDDIKNHKATMVSLVLLTIIQLTAYFSITYFIYLSLGSTGAHFFDILAIQTIVYVVASFVPTPGGAGASEGGFYLLFKAFIAKDVLLYAMALWRLITYYGNMVLSGIVLLIVKIKDIIVGKRKYR